MIPKFDFSKCLKCGRCSKNCMYQAIVHVTNRHPVLIPEQCSGCGACVIACPAKCISEDRKIIGTIYSGKKKNIEFVSCDLKPGEMLSEFVVDAGKKLVEEKQKDCDLVIIDTAAGTHCDVISAISDCDVALAVTEPTPLGAHDLKLILDLLKILNVPGKIILNRATIGDKQLIKNLAKKYNTEIIAEIPYEKSIIESYSKGEVIDHESINKIARFLEEK